MPDAGGMFHVLAAAAGLSAVLATSALAFNLVKYAGAAYLVWLGIQKLTRGAAHRRGGHGGAALAAVSGHARK